MKQINLKADNAVQSSRSSSSLSVFLGVVILFVSVAAYAFFHYQLSSTKNEIKDIEGLIKQKKSQMSNEKYAQVYLFEDKLLDLKNKMAVRGSQLANLDSIAQKTLPETVYDNLGCKIDESGMSSYSAKLTLSDIDMLAKQAKSYQLGENFANVNPLSSLLNEQAKITAEFIFDVVNKTDKASQDESSADSAGQN